MAYVHLPFLQETIRRGGTGGTVTGSTRVADPLRMGGRGSDRFEFSRDEHPTSTRSEKAFVGRAARDIIEIVGFASWLGWGAGDGVRPAATPSCSRCAIASGITPSSDPRVG